MRDNQRLHGEGQWKRSTDGMGWVGRWAEAKGAAQDRAGWRARVAALCASWHGEN